MADQYTSGLEGAELTSVSFDLLLGPVGSYIVSIGLIFFAASTIIGWAYYGEKCYSYLFGDRTVITYRIVFVLAVFIGCVSSLDLVWSFADIMNALMAIPNLIGLLGLSAVIIAETKAIIRIINSEKQNKQGKTFET